MEYFLYGTLLPDGSAPTAKPSYHTRPTDLVNLAFAQDDGFLLSAARWQMRPNGGTRPVINSKIENIDYWRNYWERGRCIIPALGYYEWSEVRGRKEPHFITVKRNAPLLFFAGFYEREPGGGYACSIITRKPSPQIAHLHNRMPVIMTPEDINDWLTGEITPDAAQTRLGTGWDGRFEYYQVRPLTGESDGEDLIEPFEPAQSSFDF
ncbi:Putative SOS response-associated peptidase YedK [Poseidonocella sedimentorum]|uniref:Abasic site processing protein n=2 Tax=Poseidonocella sedimentorum TaxID=871652 RepID=A0A1I6EMX8_9RHOB|nr:Putative SOS response-associated peptidase YedK [Poseidonocella sedimentorum]